MDEKLAKELVKTRQAVRKKYRALKTESAQSQLQLEKGYKPITEPLQKFLENFKTEAPIKKETDVYMQSQNKSFRSASSTPKKTILNPEVNPYQEYLPTHGVTFLEDKFLNDSTLNSEHGNGSSGSSTINSDAIEDTVEHSRRILLDESRLPGYTDYLESFDPLPRYYVDESIRDTQDEFDHKHGIVHDSSTDKFAIGDSELKIIGKDVQVQNITYPGTVGLYELLFKKNPKSYNNTDLNHYMDILKRANVYRKNYKSDEQIQGTTSVKYLTIIKPYLQEKGLLKSTSKNIVRTSSFNKPPPPLTLTRLRRTQSFKKSTKGGMLNLSNKPIDYIYYDDPNEIVNRLKLLVASQLAGHTGHNNEMLSIEEELREAKIIK